jgi:hypothetical protein
MSETKKCANCNIEFTITDDDISFCKKMKVPPQTRCADCCRQRRLVFRNERSLYTKKDAFSGKEIIGMYHPDALFKVIEEKTWWGDDWDPMEYGKEYDFSKPFLEQFKELMREVPRPALLNHNNQSSLYCNITTDNKNCYLVFGGDHNENCSYGTFNMYSKDSQDLYWVNRVELCYECVDSENCYRVLFAQYARDCSDSAFLYNCVGCQNCFGCVNLRKKSYCIFNTQYSKEEYEKEIKKYDISTRAGIENAKQKLTKLRLTQPHKYAEIIKSVNCTGHNIHNGKNCQNCFDAYEGIEDSKDILIAGWNLKDARNCNHLGHVAERVYDTWAAFDNANTILFSGVVQGSHNIQYCQDVFSSSNLFGCIGLRSKEYCILNKKYTKEEYEKLIPKIIEHMGDDYGEFTPPELSPFAYNETVAQEYYPLTKEEAKGKGYRWRDEEERDYKINIQPSSLPDSVEDAPDDITQKIIGCEHQGKCKEKCTTAFKIVPQELQFYKRLNIPLPHLCSNCRHYQRLKQRNPLKLWHRKCMCNGKESESSNLESKISNLYKNTTSHAHHGTDHCQNEFKTSYAPDRPEIIYCEACYQGEVA